MEITSKVLKIIEYRDEKVKIYGTVLYDSWDQKDYIDLQAMLETENGDVKLDHETVHQPKPYYRKWFKKHYYPTDYWKRCVDSEIEMMEEYVKKRIDTWKRKQDLTDGLTNSIIGLK